MSAATIRPATAADRAAIAVLVERAFGQPDEAALVSRIVADADAVLELVSETGEMIVGHVLFSRLWVEAADGRFAAVALAPVSVAQDFRRRGIAAALIEDGHRRLRAAGEALSLVLGEPAYYGRFGYEHARADAFESAFQCEALQALAFADAPARGRLVYPRAFSAL